MSTCSVENCKNECCEEEDKCILHCEKINSLENNKFFYDALIDYITPLVLRASKEYKTSIDPMEHEKTIILSFLDGVDNKDKTFDIKEALTNKITLKDIIFPINGSLNAEYNYVSVLNKLTNIEFKNCHFKDSGVCLSNNMHLRFEKCTFLGEWKHIFCEQIKYLNCEFDDFVIDNKSADKLIVKNHLLYNCGFQNICCSGTIFKKRFFKFNNINKYKKIENIELINCEFDEDFILNITDNENKEDPEYFEITNINFEHSIFHRKVKIQFCKIKEKASFFNTNFKDLADFYNTKFNEVVFERADFEKVSVFSEAEFNQDVDFKYVKFLSKSIFRDMVIEGKLNLRNSIFGDDANFLDITSKKREKDEETKEFYGEPRVIQVANRETARIIKNFYDNSNNIMEANKFYALEMKEREKELTKDILKGKNILEWLIFKIHSISSDHSQNWFLALFWITYFTFMYSFLSHFYNKDAPLLNSSITIIYFNISLIIGLFIDNIKRKIRVISSTLIAIISYIIYGTSTRDFVLGCFSKNINPFSIMLGEEDITFGLLIFKITIAYLIYQFIVSVRQNTRRK